MRNGNENIIARKERTESAIFKHQRTAEKATNLSTDRKFRYQIIHKYTFVLLYILIVHRRKVQTNFQQN